MKLRYFPLWAALLAPQVMGRVVLLYVDSAAGPRVSVVAGHPAALLDEATDPVLWTRPDPNPCTPTAKPPPGQFLARASSPKSRSVEAKPATNLAEALAAAAPAKEEPMTLYSVSWERRLELRGTAVIPFPTEGTLPGWVQSDYSRTIEAMGAVATKTRQPSALLMYADLGGHGLGLEQWRQWGVSIPADSPPGSAPFLTRQDFWFRSGVEKLTVGESPTRRSHQVRHYVRKAWTGRSSCAAVKNYSAWQKEHVQQESRLLSELAGWSLSFVLSKSGIFPAKSDVEIQ